MARKRHRSEQELPFVALMDTMTNVVGVLTIVLVMIGISLASAVNRVFSALPPATEEQIRVARAALDRLREGQAQDQLRLNELAKPDAPLPDLAAIDTELARLQRSAEEKGLKVLDLDALGKERARREAELKQKKTAMGQLLAEQDRLKGLLDATPASKPPPAKVVRIPASRPIPDGARVEHVIVTKDGAHWVDVKGAKEAFLRGFNSSLIQQLEDRRIKRGKESVVIYDHAKLARYFEARKLTYREFRMQMTFAWWTSSPILKLVPKPTSSSAGLSGALRRLKVVPKTVVMFHVTGDGFENYLAVREDCDRIGLPAGWDFAGSPEYQIHVPEIETNRPKDPPKPPQPASVKEIKRPAQNLD
jgi:hypothetical protein